MPDVKQMSGIPRPVTDLPNGAISVRLIRGDLSNNIPNHPVELRAGGKVQTQKTDESGRAQFSGIAAGTTVKASTTVDGEYLESQEFPVPGDGGVRLMLVATDKTKGPATSPEAAPINGTVVIGNQSRIVIEPGDEGINVFYLLDVDNTARAPVNTPAPFVLDVPSEATGTTVMEGSSPKATVKGTQLTVERPFAPGHTFAQVAFRLPLSGGTIELRQTFPADLEQVQVVVRKVGETTLKSAQLTEVRDVPAEGDMFIAGTGGKVAAGQPITLTVSGFPHHSNAPRAIALALAGAIALIGVWAGSRRDDDSASRAAERKRLIARREKLFQGLVRLEHDQRNGRVDERRYATRREELVAALEHVYGALDDRDGVPDPAGRAGVATPVGKLGAL
ncbi:MAG: hypothetical protein HY048_01670 [Acidobacteria bacterium]|nr:hypothetical protein [Acidobacteriota bacterium]